MRTVLGTVARDGPAPGGPGAEVTVQPARRWASGTGLGTGWVGHSSCAAARAGGVGRCRRRGRPGFGWFGARAEAGECEPGPTGLQAGPMVRADAEQSGWYGLPSRTGCWQGAALRSAAPPGVAIEVAL